MKEVGWIKLSVNTPRDEKIRKLKRKNKEFPWIWICLLTLAGRTNENGLIQFAEGIPYTIADLADYTGCQAKTMESAIAAMYELEMLGNTEGFLTIINWEKYQTVERLDKIREDTRKRVATYRAKRNADVTQNVTDM